MKKNSLLMFLVLVIMVIINTEFVSGHKMMQKEIKIYGKIIDASTKEPLPGASVSVKDHPEKGTITSEIGVFELMVEKQDIIIISFIGYVPQELPATGLNNATISLQEDHIEIEDVIVVGYGIQKKGSVVGSVSQIKGKPMEATPVSNLSSNLSGRIPGLTSINRRGDAGLDDATLLIRGLNTLGDNSPLIVIDGIPNRAGGLSRISPTDIASVSVLKDASAAIYGSQAANGVILVTTKRGQTGKISITFDGNVGVGQPTVMPKYADAANYAQMLNEVAEYRGKGKNSVYTPEEIEKFANGSDPLRYPNTNWVDEVYKKYSLQQQYNVSVSGGSEKIQYYVSGNYLFQDGFYRDSKSKFEQYGLRSNIDIKVNDYVKIGITSLLREEVNPRLSGSLDHVERLVQVSFPTTIARWPNGETGPPVTNNENPVTTITDLSGEHVVKNTYIQNSINLSIGNPWVKGLTLNLAGTYDKHSLFDKDWKLPVTTNIWASGQLDENGYPILSPNVYPTQASLFEQMQQDYLISFNSTINYENRIGDHGFSLVGGFEYIGGKLDWMTADRYYYLSTAIPQLFAGDDKDKNNSGNASHHARQSFFGRLHYDFANKYIFEVLARADASYIFPDNKRRGFFPGLMAGWRISEEDFWKDNISLINYLKLRVSWGQTGNDRINPYQYLATYQYSSYAHIVDGTENKTIEMSRVPNPNITWEVANQTDIGLEGQMFDNRLSFEVDYFYNKRNNILWNRNASVPSFSGITLPKENIGVVQNTGFDMRISWADNVRDFKYQIGLTGGYAQNKILDWDEAEGAPDYQRSTGKPMNATLYYLTDGVYATQADVDAGPTFPGARPGDVKFIDYNGDGVVNGLDRVRIKKTDLPPLTGGVDLLLNYKQFTLDLLIQGSAGAVRHLCVHAGSIGNYLESEAIGRWTPDNPSSTIARASNWSEEYWQDYANMNDYHLRNLDFIRLKSLQLSYDLPQNIISKIGISGLKIYVSGFNLFTITKLKDIDPESYAYYWGASYPLQRIYNVGLSLRF